MTFMSHSITQISMSALHKKNYVMPLLTLRAVTQMHRTIASATMGRTVQSLKVQYNLVHSMSILRCLKLVTTCPQGILQWVMFILSV